MYHVSYLCSVCEMKHLLLSIVTKIWKFVSVIKHGKFYKRQSEIVFKTGEDNKKFYIWPLIHLLCTASLVWSWSGLSHLRLRLLRGNQWEWAVTLWEAERLRTPLGQLQQFSVLLNICVASNGWLRSVISAFEERKPCQKWLFSLRIIIGFLLIRASSLPIVLYDDGFLQTPKTFFWKSLKRKVATKYFWSSGSQIF